RVSRSPPAPRSKGETEADGILVVEDDPDLRALLVGELRDGGYPTREAGSAEAAEVEIDRGGIGLVASDLRLPGNDGHALLLRTRARPDPPSFLVVTGFGTID